MFAFRHEHGFLKGRRLVRRGVLVTVGFILSPLSWWNDAVVNVPLAYVMAWPLAWAFPSLFLPTFIFCYWVTNVLGFVLMHLGLKGGERREALRHDWWRLLLISSLYSLLIALLVWWGWVPVPGAPEGTME